MITRKIYIFQIFSILVLSLILFGCNNSTKIPHYFLFTTRNTDSKEGDFIVVTSNPEIITIARNELLLPENERKLIIIGKIEKGNSGHNAGWNWHFIEDEWNLSDQAMELCDATPMMVQKDPDKWIGATFCPWSSYILRELPNGINDRI
jgi:hypothetical protein